ncbi:hypothetical protein RUM43_008439 [Polyplax serrata]|uniref:Actin-related protein 2/3 complex subunit 5 n=1 Tax=Polyplax serrata TaxID=468196 RepID=A0AAN8P940_POLSC
MAKNTLSSAFRKIDVDQYNEDNFKEDEQNELQSPPAGPDEGEVTQMISQGRYGEALRTVLSSAPLGSKSLQIKENAFNITLKVLMAIKASQMDEIIGTLDTDLLDVLMKYVYKGFEIPSEGSSGHLLVWHEKVFAAAGAGSIVRVLTDSKRV